MYNIKIAIRNLRRNGIYSGINTAGLAISLAACILIMLWVWDELSFDRFHSNADRIYVINAHIDKMSYPATSPPFADAIMEEMPAVENSCRIRPASVGFLEYDGQKFYDFDAISVDSSFFTIFSFKLLKGSVKDVTPDAVVLSQTAARRIFRDNDPVGETLKGTSDHLYRVVGIMEDLPANTIFSGISQNNKTLDALFFPDFKTEKHWGSFSLLTFLLLHGESNTGAVGEDIAELFKRRFPEIAESNFKFTIQNIRQMHLYRPDGTDSGMQTVRLFFIIGILILVIAGINYVNLVTARASKRSKEIGLRKVVGASKINLLGQLMNEAIVLFLLSVAIALVIVWCALPFYNSLTAKTFDIVLFLPQILTICAAAFLSVTVLAGIYPALMLSSFKPSDAFKNKSGRSKNAYLRKVLVVVQFVFTAGLIMGTLVMSLQLRHIQILNPGYDRENVVMIPMYRMDLNLVRGELLDLPGIAGISASDEEICNTNNGGGTEWEGKEDPNEIFMTTNLKVESHFLSTMGIKLVEGYDFTGTEADKDGFIINETAARLMGFDEPIGKTIDLSGDRKRSVIGVVSDFHFTDMHRKIGPVVIYCEPQESPNLLYARIESGKTRIALDNLEKVWKRYNADYQFTYKFVDETFEKMHRSDMRTGMLFNLFAVIAIIISCLGLFGLVTFTAVCKRKEIGIRKVLGASVQSIVIMLSKEFLILVGIAMLIAFPLTYWLLNGMLEDFAYRIAISWWIFVVSALIVIVLTALTVGFQALKAAMANPIKAIKSE